MAYFGRGFTIILALMILKNVCSDRYNIHKESPWVQAQALCQRNGATLPCLNEKEDFIDIRQMLLNNNLDSVWSGMHINVTEPVLTGCSNLYMRPTGMNVYTVEHRYEENCSRLCTAYRYFGSLGNKCMCLKSLQFAGFKSCQTHENCGDACTSANNRSLIYRNEKTVAKCTKIYLKRTAICVNVTDTCHDFDELFVCENKDSTFPRNSNENQRCEIQNLNGNCIPLATLPATVVTTQHPEKQSGTINEGLIAGIGAVVAVVLIALTISLVFILSRLRRKPKHTTDQNLDKVAVSNRSYERSSFTNNSSVYDYIIDSEEIHVEENKNKPVDSAGKEPTTEITNPENGAKNNYFILEKSTEKSEEDNVGAYVDIAEKDYDRLNGKHERKEHKLSTNNVYSHSTSDISADQPYDTTNDFPNAVDKNLYNTLISVDKDSDYNILAKR